MSRITPELPEPLRASLAAGAPALLLTAAEDGWANSAYTWVVALDARRMRFGADDGSSVLRDMQAHGQASLHIMAPGNLAFLVKGRVRLIRHRIAAAAPAPIMLFELEVASAKDQSWPGVAIAPLSYEWPVEQRDVLLRMEQAVYGEMRA